MSSDFSSNPGTHPLDLLYLEIVQPGNGLVVCSVEHSPEIGSVLRRYRAPMILYLYTPLKERLSFQLAVVKFLQKRLKQSGRAVDGQNCMEKTLYCKTPNWTFFPIKTEIVIILPNLKINNWLKVFIRHISNIQRD